MLFTCFLPAEATQLLAHLGEVGVETCLALLRRGGLLLVLPEFLLEEIGGEFKERAEDVLSSSEVDVLSGWLRDEFVDVCRIISVGLFALGGWGLY